MGFTQLKSGDTVCFASNTNGPEYDIVQQHIIDLLNGDMSGGTKCLRKK